MLQVNYSGKFNMLLQMPILVQWKSTAPTKVGCLQLDDEVAEFESRHLAKSKPLLKILPSTRGPHGDVKRKKGGGTLSLQKGNNCTNTYNLHPKKLSKGKFLKVPFNLHHI